MKKGDHLFLVDGSAYIFRAYHALPPLTRKSDGLPIGAISGFCNMLWKLVCQARDTSVGVVPTHFAVIFDYSSTTFRNEIYPEYKANRSEPPEDLKPQFALIRDATRAFDLPCIETEGFEADDLIASYARKAREVGADVTIVSSDKDLMQLLGPNVILYDTMKDKRLGVEEVREKFGVGPEKMIDLQALAGDSTDNIPGVPGIGPKTAAQLLEEYGDLETLLERAGEIKQQKRRENLVEHAPMARLSKRLVTLKDDVPLDVPLGDLVLEPPNGAKLISFLKAMELNTLTRKVASQTDTDASTVEADEINVHGFEMRGPDLDGSSTSAGDIPEGDIDGQAGFMASPQERARKRKGDALGSKFDAAAYVCVRDLKTLEAWVDRIAQAGRVAIDTETNSLDAMVADLVGLSLALGENDACYVPFTHVEGEADLLGEQSKPEQVDREAALEILRPVLTDLGILKIGQNMKFDWLILARHGVDMVNMDDTMLLSYVLDAGRQAHGMDELSKTWLGHTPIPYKEIAGTGKNAITFERVPLDKATAYAAEDADVTLRLWKVLKPRLATEKMTPVYERLERPLIHVIPRMESRGILVDRQILSRISGSLAQAAAAIEVQIHELAGESFNIGSPKQLGEILFGKMSLPGGRKTATGAYSTSVQVLEELAAEGHELPRKVVGWRQLTKLKSTYADALPEYINFKTGRVHTSFAMASTSTGRFSSSDPNLQNIPVRTAEGRQIRTAFIAAPGQKLISADYSQIELRILAHMAHIPQLTQAFADGMDIHAMTASEMFNVPVKDMQAEVRRRAKAINFGIIYGISAFGLANQLGIERSEAGDYIKTYFQRFPGIKDYMEDTKAFAKEHGFVETVFGRRAHYPDIKASNPSQRAFNERAAINAPIQGSAADIIRRAMVRMDGVLVEEGLTAKMLLQVHDELIFEAPKEEVDAVIKVAKSVMEKAPEPALRLKVPLQVDARAADNWNEAH